MKKLSLLGALFMATLLLTGCDEVSQPFVSNLETEVPSFEEDPMYYANKTVEVELVKAIDGDTAEFEYMGETYTVRFLLVDTPETNHPEEGSQPIGKEAKEFTRDLLENAETIELEFDEGGAEVDKYGRLLAYVKVDGVYVQEELLKNGYARVAYIYEPNTKYVKEFEQIEAEAKEQGLNIWSVPGYVQDDGFHEEVWPDWKEQ